MSKSKFFNILSWVGSVVVFALVGLSGVSKFLQPSGWNMHFERWGLPAALVPVVGAAEIVGCLLLLVPKTSPMGGFVVAVVMLGATITHLMNGEAIRVPITLALMAIAIAIAVYRMKRRAVASSHTLPFG